MSFDGVPEDGASQTWEEMVAGATAGENSDLVESLRELSELASARLPLRSMLTKVAEYAVLAIPGAEGAGLTLIADDRSETLVSTNQMVTDVDAVQYGIRQGPCITAATDARTVMSQSLGDDKRWPEFGARVAGLGVHSALSLPLIAPNRVVGAMNIYARARNAFDNQAAKLGQLFAVPAAVAVQNGQLLSQAQALATQLQAALADRAVIDQAIGLMIGRDEIDAEEAERRLRAISRNRGQTLHEVAEATVGQAVSDRSAHLRSPTGDLP